MVQDVVFVLMMVIAIGAGIITAVHEFVGTGEEKKGITENNENKKNNEKEK